MKERLVHFNFELIPNYQASKITDSCKSAFDFPPFPVSSKFSPILGFRLFTIPFMWNNQIYFQVLKSFSKWAAIISFISNKPCRTLLRATPCSARHLNGFKRFFSQFYFRWRCRGKGASQRNTLAVDHHHPLRSFALFGFSDTNAPFFTGAKLPSMKAFSQSSIFFSSSFDRNFRHISSQTPWSSQGCNRRQHVIGLRYRSGRSCQRAPVRKIHKIQY